jgi:hypothetical protein
MKRACAWGIFASFTVCCAPGWGQAPQAAAPQALNIVIVEGEGAINNIRGRVNREPIIQVEDENHRPIAGTAVVFFLPNQGPGGVFANGTKTLTVSTDAQGRGTAAGIQRNNISGQMQIRVTASFAGQTATAVITQTNIAGGGGPGLSTAVKVLIGVGLAGGAVAGAIAATHGGGSSSTTSPPIGITAGTPSVTHP